MTFTEFFGLIVITAMSLIVAVIITIAVFRVGEWVVRGVIGGIRRINRR